MTSTLRILSTVALTLATAASPAMAGVLIVETQEQPGGTVSSTTRIQIDGTRVRVDTTAGGAPRALIFDGDRQIFYMIDPARKSYMEMTREDLEKLSSQVGGAMDQMRAQLAEQLKNMPPEQRAAIERQMQAMTGMSAARTSVTYAKVRSGEKVGQWVCDVYEGRRDQAKEWEVCTVDPKALGLTVADFGVIQQLGEFFKGLARGSAADAFSVGAADWEQQQGFPGIPIQRVAFEAGKPRATFRITEARPETFPASLFQIPAGFTKQSLPAMTGGRP